MLIKDHIIWASMVSFDLYWLHVGFVGGPVTTSSNCTSLLLRWLVGGRMRPPRMIVGSGIAGSQNFIPGAGAQFWLSRDFAKGCHT
jgi:hypothetical protein